MFELLLLLLLYYYYIIIKTAEPIEMPFGLRTRVGPGNHALDGVQIPHEKGNFEGEEASHCKV